MNQEKLAAELVGKAIEAAASRVVSLSDSARKLLRSYNGYLEQTYTRVSEFKTLVNPHEPLPLLDNFVSMSISHRTGDGEKTFDEITLNEKASSGGRFVISALAGRGKSILLRYLALVRYHAPDGTIPLFVELRGLNSLSSKDLLAFIHATYSTGRHVALDEFKRSLASGVFVLFLDGFDEVDYDNRETVERQIVELGRQFPEATIVISGRPDPKFGSWTSYQVFNILPMTQDQIIELIEGLKYNPESKRKFIKQVKGELFVSHEYFLTTPLLAILMLLTFDKFASIPEKMHVFYENAFDTLFSQHDASKELYTKKRRSGLSIDVFKRVTAVFSAMTYSQKRFQFRESELLEFAKSSLEYSAVSSKSESFANDLIEAVCILQRDGLEISFTHRSFQEFFRALFLARGERNVRDRFFKEQSFRVHDSVLGMLFDMAQEQIESEWVAPFIDAFLLSLKGETSEEMAYIKAVHGVFVFAIVKDQLWEFFVPGGSVWYEVACISRMYPAHFKGSGWVELLRSDNVKTLTAALKEIEAERVAAGDERFKSTAQLNQKVDPGTPVELNEIALTDEDQSWLKALGFLDNARASIKALKAIRRDIEQRRKVRGKVFDSIFLDTAQRGRRGLIT